MSRLLKKIFITNLETKIIALLMAIVVWVYLNLSTTDTFETTASIKVKDSHKFDGVFALSTLRGNPIEGKIRVSISGPKKDMRIIRQRDIACEITPDVRAGVKSAQEVIYHVKLIDFNLQEFEIIKITAIPEEEIRVRYAPFTEKSVTLAYLDEPLAIELGKGLMLAGTDAPREAIALVPLGEEDDLNTRLRQFGGLPIRQASLKAVEERDMSAPLEIDYDLLGKDVHVKFKGRPEIKAKITKQLVGRVIPGIPVKILRNASAAIKNIRLSSTECSVAVSVAEDVADAITKDDIICYGEIVVPDGSQKGSTFNLRVSLSAVMASGGGSPKARIVRIMPPDIDALVELAGE